MYSILQGLQIRSVKNSYLDGWETFVFNHLLLQYSWQFIKIQYLQKEVLIAVIKKLKKIIYKHANASFTFSKVYLNNN